LEWKNDGVMNLYTSVYSLRAPFSQVFWSCLYEDRKNISPVESSRSLQ